MMSPIGIDILLVEDHHDIASNIVQFFSEKGHQIDAIYSANGALSLLEQQQYDVLILDVMLPGMNGFSLAEKIRQQKLNTPIIFLTARDALDDKKEGFIVGADDYLTKPFELEELNMRVEALHRRATGLHQQEIILGDWKINTNRQEIHYKNTKLKTTHIGYKVFFMLACDYPAVTSKRTIEKKLWGEYPPDSDALRSHIFSLRKALKIITDDTVIETVHGVGFRLIGKTMNN